MDQRLIAAGKVERLRRVPTLTVTPNLTELQVESNRTGISLSSRYGKASRSPEDSNFSLSMLKKGKESPQTRTKLFASSSNPAAYIPKSKEVYQKLSLRFPSIANSSQYSSFTAGDQSSIHHSKTLSRTRSEFNKIAHGGNFSISKALEEPSTERLQDIRERIQPVMAKREEMRKMDFSARSYMNTLKILIIHFETILNKYTENILTLSSEELSHAKSFTEAELMTYSLIKQLWSEVERLTQTEKTIAALKEQNEILRKSSRPVVHQDQKIEELTRKLKEANERADSHDFLMTYQKNLSQLEKDKLKEESQTLSSKIKESSDQLVKVTLARNTYEAKLRAVEKERDSLLVKIDRIEANKATMNIKMEYLVQDNEAKAKEIADLEKRIFSYEYDAAHYKELYAQYRETANMAREECDTYHSLYTSVSEVYERVKERLKNYSVDMVSSPKAKDGLKGNLTYSPQPKSGAHGTMDHRNDVRADYEVMSFVTEKFFKKSKKSDFEKINKPKVHYEALSKMDLKDFTVKRMPFEALYEELESNIKREAKPPSFDMHFVATVRAILDSKYNEFICYGDDYHNCSRFSDFVFAWLGKFTLDSKTRRIRLLSIDDPEPDILRRRFLSALQNPKSYKLWDLITFKEFLTDYTAADEIVFYLHCRFLLFQGPMTAEASRTLNYKCFVPIKRVYDVIDAILKPSFPKDDLTMLKKKLRERIVKKKIENELIDSSFCLRVLLESYKRIKLHKLQKAYKLINSQNNVSSEPDTFSISYLSFASCMHFIHPEASELETTELFKRSWSIGQGKVDAPSVLTALNDAGFFLKCMKLTTHLETPTLGENLSLQPGSKWEFLANKYEETLHIVEELNNVGRELGVEGLINQLYAAERFIQNKFQMDVGALNGKNLVAFISWFSGTTSKIAHWKYMLTSVRRDERERELIERLVGTWESILVDFNGFVKDDKEKLQKELKSALKIQKLYRSHLSPWKKLFGELFKQALTGQTPQSKKDQSLTKPDSTTTVTSPESNAKSLSEQRNSAPAITSVTSLDKATKKSNFSHPKKGK